jgi:xanthine/uracil permease
MIQYAHLKHYTFLVTAFDDKSSVEAHWFSFLIYFTFRLPIVQGMSFAFLLPAAALLSLEKWKCPTTGKTFTVSLLTNPAAICAVSAPFKRQEHAPNKGKR